MQTSLSLISFVLYYLTNTLMAVSAASVESKLRGALWGLFSGDALAAPTHWYYGGTNQIKEDYGSKGITDYTKPKTNLYGSIMNKSNINGGGRGSFNKVSGISIIGDVINHGKREYWDPSKNFHYHATLQAGENTLEAQLVRVLMKSIVANNGSFNADHFRSAYIKFMTTPNSHNDCYASTCHRMFFANMMFKKLPPPQCPDNDSHNVDTIDGLVLPTIVALAVSAKNGNSIESKEAARKASAEVCSVTRRSDKLERVSKIWSDVIFDTLYSTNDTMQSSSDYMSKILSEAGRAFGSNRSVRADRSDEMSACYLDQSFPPTLDMILKYHQGNDVWKGLIANANVGGENVHRGAILGAVLGEAASVQNLPLKLISGLYDKEDISKEIDAFVEVVLNQGEVC